jgi:hypothetical protein
MGRGLSDLQRYVLAEAGKRSRVYYAEVLAGFYGWRPRRELARDAEGKLRSPGSWHFSPRKVGENRYNKAMAALSRACARLGTRGLVTCLKGVSSRWAGVEITDKGKEWLSVNTRAPLPEC